MIPKLDFDFGSRKPAPEQIWALANTLRKQVQSNDSEHPLEASSIAKLCPRLAINGRVIAIGWDLEHRVHDTDGLEVYGVCEIEPGTMGTVSVSINGPLLQTRPDLLLSTAAHELGHVVFDAPGILARQGGTTRQYRTAESAARDFIMAETRSEWMANEFMGALLVPALALHRRLLAHAREERLATVKTRSLGHPAWPVVSADSDPDALAGITDVLAQEFGVSPRFISVRLSQYGLIAHGSSYGGRR